MTPTPRDKLVECPVCNGGGYCPDCGGLDVLCELCMGVGDCPNCDGKGSLEESDG